MQNNYLTGDILSKAPDRIEQNGTENKDMFHTALLCFKHLEAQRYIYTYTDAKIETGSEKGLQLAIIPYSLVQLGIGYASVGWQLKLFTSYNNGARRALYTNPGESTTDFISSRLSLDLSTRIPVTRNIGIVVYLENLADVPYKAVFKERQQVNRHSSLSPTRYCN